MRYVLSTLVLALFLLPASTAPADSGDTTDIDDLVLSTEGLCKALDEEAVWARELLFEPEGTGIALCSSLDGKSCHRPEGSYQICEGYPGVCFCTSGTWTCGFD